LVLESNELVRGLTFESRDHRFDAVDAVDTVDAGSDQKRSWFFSFLNGGTYFAISNYLFYELLV
jgi:hypothetical protein